MKKLIAIILLASSGFLLAQSDFTRFTELQRIFFVSEISGLASNSNNPAGLSMRANDDGFLLGYDFKEFENQGNSSAYFSMSNFGFSYQDVYNYNNVRVQNYSLNLSVGNDVISIGTSNRLISSSYLTYDNQQFSFDAGLIIQPAKFFSIGLLARNLNETSIDSIDYYRNYTAGFGIILLNEKLQLFSEVNFKDNTKIDDVSGSIGLIISPVKVFEFRGGVFLNPSDIIDIRGLGAPVTIDQKYEAFVAASFLIDNSFRLTASARFNDAGKLTRYSTVLAIPLKTVKF